MSITGKQVSAGVEIMRIILSTKPKGRSEVSDIIENAPMVASIFCEEEKDIDALGKAIVERMVTIKVEVS